MTSIYYFAAWTDSGCLLGCSHEHGTVGEAVACFSCAGGYVVAVENGVLRALTTEEESQFQLAISEAYRDRPTTVEAFHYDTSGYAVMIPVRLADRWAWTTWMRYDTYEQAAPNARTGDKMCHLGLPNGRICVGAVTQPCPFRLSSHERTGCIGTQGNPWSNSSTDFSTIMALVSRLLLRMPAGTPTPRLPESSTITMIRHPRSICNGIRSCC